MWNKNRPEMVGQLVVTDYRHTTSTGAIWQGNDRVRELLQSLHKAFAELHYTIDAMTAEGGLVSTRATVSGIHVGPVLGFVPTNKRVTYQE
jgi:predicted ester cyclase